MKIEEIRRLSLEYAKGNVVETKAESTAEREVWRDEGGEPYSAWFGRLLADEDRRSRWAPKKRLT